MWQNIVSYGPHNVKAHIVPLRPMYVHLTFQIQPLHGFCSWRWTDHCKFMYDTPPGVRQKIQQVCPKANITSSCEKSSTLNINRSLPSVHPGLPWTETCTSGQAVTIPAEIKTTTSNISIPKISTRSVELYTKNTRRPHYTCPPQTP